MVMTSDIQTTDPSYTPRAWYKPFLATLCQWANVKEAAGAAGISRQTAYDARKTDARFAQAWAEAEADGVDRLRITSWKLALGIKDPGWDQRPDSDILKWLLRSHDPFYREVSKQEISGPDGGPVQLQPVAPDADRMTRVITILKEVGALSDGESQRGTSEP